MRDHLENFINENREQFDDKVPSLKVWADIEKELEPPKAKRISFFRIASVAASVIILLGVGAFFGKNYTGTTIPSNEPIVSLAEISPEYAVMETEYQKEINQKHARLANYNVDESVNEDLMDLDLTLEELRKELVNVPKGSEEQIVQAMIRNYQSKIRILEIVLEKIDQSKSQNKEGYEM